MKDFVYVITAGNGDILGVRDSFKDAEAFVKQLDPNTKCIRTSFVEFVYLGDSVYRIKKVPMGDGGTSNIVPEELFVLTSQHANSDSGLEKVLAIRLNYDEAVGYMKELFPDIEEYYMGIEKKTFKLKSTGLLIHIYPRKVDSCDASDNDKLTVKLHETVYFTNRDIFDRISEDNKSIIKDELRKLVEDNE